MLNSSVLVLNRSFLPIHVTSVRRAFTLLYQDIPRVVNEEYRTFDFRSWQELAVARDAESIGSVRGRIRVPRVIVLTAFDRIPRRHVRFSRLNIYARDDFTCAYCQKKLPLSRLTYDHVLPRSRGGRTEWENIVTACVPCNAKKANKTPDESGMFPRTAPFRPTSLPLMPPLIDPDTAPIEWRDFTAALRVGVA